MEALVRNEMLEAEILNKEYESNIEYIESDTKGKLRKIIEGSIFSGPTVFITELFQNAYRAKAKNVYVTIKDDCMSVYDDGCGLKNTKALLTFDYSEWDSTKEGFGIGFWSVLSIPELLYVDIKSRKNHLILDVEQVKDTLAVETSILNESLKGFKVELKSNYILTNSAEIINTLKVCGKYMPFDLYVNDRKIEKENLFDKVTGEYSQTYNTRLFETKMSVSSKHYDYPEVYYENRLVEKLYDFPYINAVILLKKNSVNLKEPDRTSIIYNHKRDKLEEKVKECVVDLYKSYLNINENDHMLDEYEQPLSIYLTPKDYCKFLYADETLKLTPMDKMIEILNNTGIDETKILDVLNSTVEGDDEWVVKENTSEELSANLDFYSISQNDCTDINDLNINVFKIQNKVFIKKEIKTDESEEVEDDIVKEDAVEDIDTSDFEANFNNEDIVETTAVCRKEDILKKSKNNNKVNIKDLIKNNKYCMWVKSSEVDTYLNYISIAEYNGVKVFKAKNVLFEKYFEFIGLTHVSDLNNAISTDYNIIKNNPMSKKEEMFLLLLEPIRKMYKLEPNVFQVGNIEQKIQFTLGGKVFSPKIRKNTSKKIETYAVNRGNTIIFDRHAINLKLFSLNIDKDNFSVGKHELKCLMYNLDTISHELAHLLYGTTDNTKEHTTAEKKISEEIIDYIVKKY